MEVNLSQKVAHKYSCQNCDYNTSKKCDYMKHLATDKHKINTMEVNGNNMEVQKVAQFICNCSRIFNTNGGLWKHKQKCSNNTYDNDNNNDTNNDTRLSDKELINILVKQNEKL